jgi:hypothetical protein
MWIWWTVSCFFLLQTYLLNTYISNEEGEASERGDARRRSDTKNLHLLQFSSPFVAHPPTIYPRRQKRMRVPAAAGSLWRVASRAAAPPAASSSAASSASSAFVRRLNTHEAISQNLMREYGIPVPPGAIAKTPEEAEKVFSTNFNKGELRMSPNARGPSEWFTLSVLEEGRASCVCGFLQLYARRFGEQRGESSHQLADDVRHYY